MKSRNEQLEKLAAECDVNMEDLNGTVQPIIDSCTKDAILVKYCCSPFSALPFFSPISSVWSDSSILLCHLALIVLDRRFLLKELTWKFKLLSMGRDLARGQCWRSNVWIEISAFGELSDLPSTDLFQEKELFLVSFIKGFEMNMTGYKL